MTRESGELCGPWPSGLWGPQVRMPRGFRPSVKGKAPPACHWPVQHLFTCQSSACLLPGTRVAVTNEPPTGTPVESIRESDISSLSGGEAAQAWHGPQHLPGRRGVLPLCPGCCKALTAPARRTDTRAAEKPSHRSKSCQLAFAVCEALSRTLPSRPAAPNCYNNCIPETRKHDIGVQSHTGGSGAAAEPRLIRPTPGLRLSHGYRFLQREEKTGLESEGGIEGRILRFDQPRKIRIQNRVLSHPTSCVCPEDHRAQRKQ